MICILDNELLVMYGDRPKTLIKTMLDKTEFLKEVPKNNLIGIKPNLVLAKPSASGATTDPELVSVLIEFLQERNYNNIKILESSWVGDKTSRAFRICGYQQLAQRYNIQLVDLKKDEYVRFAFDDFNLKVCKIVTEVDYLINVPVLKAHCQTKLTCALKNLKGCIPDSEKRRFHTQGLHKPIAYLNKAIKTNLVIVDGIIGDLTFEEGGNPVQMNRVIIGKDPVLVDSYACELLGYNRSDIEYISLAEKMGVGKGDLAQARVYELNKDSKHNQKLEPTEKVQQLARWIEEDNACSACYGSLIHALERLREKGKLDKLIKQIAIGQGYKNKPVETIGIGTCTQNAIHHVPGCPPKASDVVKELENILGE